MSLLCTVLTFLAGFCGQPDWRFGKKRSNSALSIPRLVWREGTFCWGTLSRSSTYMGWCPQDLTSSNWHFGIYFTWNRQIFATWNSLSPQLNSSPLQVSCPCSRKPWCRTCRLWRPWSAGRSVGRRRWHGGDVQCVFNVNGRPTQLLQLASTFFFPKLLLLFNMDIPFTHCPLPSWTGGNKCNFRMRGAWLRRISLSKSLERAFHPVHYCSIPFLVCRLDLKVKEGSPFGTKEIIEIMVPAQPDRDGSPTVCYTYGP